MEIHELNNFTGKLDSGTYIAVDNTADTGKISYPAFMAPIETEISNLKSTSLNLLNPYEIVQSADYVRVTPNKIGLKVYNIQAGTYKDAKIEIQLEPNTRYTISARKKTNSGAGWIGYCESTDSGATYPSTVSVLISRNDADNTLWTNSFTTTTGYVRIRFFCTYNTSVLGDVDFSDLMLVKGDFSYFQPYTFAEDVQARHIAEENSNILEYVHKLKKSTVLTTGTDLNSITAAGSYVANNGTLARSLINCPTKTVFALQVEYETSNDPNYLTQRIIDGWGNEYIRSRFDGIFMTWRQVCSGMSNFGTMLKTTLKGSIPTTAVTAYDDQDIAHTVYKSNLTYSEFLAQTWDVLDAEYENTVTKEQIGMDSSNTYPLYKYVITPDYYSRTVLLTAGMHGAECEAMWGLYRMIRFWLRRYDVMLGRKIKYDTRFVIIPIVNPWGMMNVDTAGSNCGRNCSLGIQPYRDFPNTLSSVSATSEAQAVRTVMADYDFDYYADFHTDPFTASKGCYGYALDNSKTRGALFNITRSFYYVLLKEYGFTETIFDGVIDHSTTTSTVGLRYAENLLGIPSNLLEVAIGGFADPSSTWTMKAAVDWYINAVSDMLENI